MATKRQREQREQRRTSAKEWADKQERAFEATCVKLPDGVEFFKLEVGKHQVDFMPFRAGAGNPHADEGYEHFERQYAAHRVPGPDGRTRLYACLYETFGKRCPVCEYANHRDTSSDLAKDLRARVRNLWLVNDKPGNAKNKLKVLDQSHFNRGMGFGEQMTEAIKEFDGESPFLLEGGGTAILTVKEQSFPGGKYNAITRIAFAPRSYSYPEELLDSMPCLDECLIEMDYDILKRILHNEPAEPVNGKVISKAGSKIDEEEPEDEDQEEEEKDTATIAVGNHVLYDEEVCEVIRIASDGTLTLRTEDGDTHKGVDPDDIEITAADSEDDEDEDDSPPSSRVKKPAGSTRSKKSVTDDDDEPLEEEDEEEEPEDDDEDDDVDDDEEEDEPAPKKKAPTKRR